MTNKPLELLKLQTRCQVLTEQYKSLGTTIEELRAQIEMLECEQKELQRIKSNVDAWHELNEQHKAKKEREKEEENKYLGGFTAEERDKHAKVFTSKCECCGKPLLWPCEICADCLKKHFHLLDLLC